MVIFLSSPKSHLPPKKKNIGKPYILKIGILKSYNEEARVKEV